MAVIAVTGATGFIGRHLVRQIEIAGHQSVALTREQLRMDGAAAYPRRADAIVHLAARAHVLSEREKDPVSAFAHANLDLTRTVSLAARTAQIRRFVFISTAGVLGGYSPPEGFTDDSPVAPHDDYSRTKLAAEDWLRTGIGDGLETVVLRPPLVYGPGAPGNFFRIMRAASSGWPLPIAGLTAPRSMLGVRNLCDLIIKAALDPRSAGATMLVSDTETTSVSQLGALIAVLSGRKSRQLYLPRAAVSTLLRLAGRHGDATRLTRPFLLRTSRAADFLDWRAPYTLQEELLWTVLAGRQKP